MIYIVEDLCQISTDIFENFQFILAVNPGVSSAKVIHDIGVCNFKDDHFFMYEQLQ